MDKLECAGLIKRKNNIIRLTDLGKEVDRPFGILNALEEKEATQIDEKFIKEVLRHPLAFLAYKGVMVSGKINIDALLKLIDTHLHISGLNNKRRKSIKMLFKKIEGLEDPKQTLYMIARFASINPLIGEIFNISTHFDILKRPNEIINAISELDKEEIKNLMNNLTAVNIFLRTGRIVYDPTHLEHVVNATSIIRSNKVLTYLPNSLRGTRVYVLRKKDNKCIYVRDDNHPIVKALLSTASTAHDGNSTNA